MLYVILMFVFSYLIGGLNFSIIISKHFLKSDVRQYGSGNAGFTNSLRSFGKGIAAIVFLGDILKSVFVIVISWIISNNDYVTYAACLGVILGHNFPLYYKFKGGKGILTTVMVIVLLNPIYGTIFTALAVGLMFLTGYVSLGSIVICLSFPVITLIFHGGDVPRLIFSIAVAALGIFMHRGNIKRLLNGTENRFGGKKNA